MGFTARETSGSASAVIRRRDGVVGGAILATVSLAEEESVRELLNVQVTHAAGVYVERVLGAAEGSVYTL